MVNNLLFDTFFVVTTPTPVSELADICFETNFEGFFIQVLGGLKISDIHGIYNDEDEAEKIAKALLADRDRTKE